MAQVERMTLEMDVIAKVDGAIGGINKIKNTLQGIKMPPKLGADLEKSFSNLGGLFEKYKDQVKNGFNTKGDVSNFAKTARQIDNEVDRLTKNLHKLTGEKITLNIETDKLKTAQGELTKLIAQKEKLMSDVKSSFGLDSYFKAFKDSTVGRRGTKINDAANVVQTSLQRGDIAKALEDVKTLEAEYNRMSQARKDAFAKLTGVSGDTAIQQLKANLQTATQETTRLDNSIKTTSQDLENIPIQMMNDAGKLAEQAAQGMDKLASETKQVTASSTEAARATQSMSQQLQDLQHTTQYFFSLRNMINLFKRGIDSAVQSVKELDAAMTDTAVVTDFSVADMWKDLPKYTQVANELGATTQGAYETMTLYYQQGLNQQQAFEIGAETMKMARIAGLEYAEATDMMTAALRGFNMELNEISAQRINDVYSKLAAVTASDTEELGTAMQRTASIAHSAGMSFEGTTAFLAQAIETTREPAENLGTAMKTIIARFQEMKKNPLEMVEVDGEEVSYNKVDEALQSIGVSLKDTNGQFRELDQVFLDISQRWDGLTQTQQRYIATIAAGSRQQSRFIAMMSNYGRTVELMDAANNSAGASEEQFGKTMDSLEAKLNQLHNAWQAFTMGIANNGMIKFAVDGITSLLTVTNNLINTLSLGSPVLKSFLSLFTAFTGLKVAGKFANSLIGGLGGLIDPQSGFFKGFFGGGVIGGRMGANAAQAHAISDPIVQAINNQTAALGGKITANGTAQPANNNVPNFKDYTNALTSFRNLSRQAGKTSIQDVFGSLSGINGKQQSMILSSQQGTMRAINAGMKDLFKGKNLRDESQKFGMKLADGITTGLNKGDIIGADLAKMIGSKDLYKIAESAGPEAAKAYTQAVQAELENNQTSIYDAAEKLWHQKARGGDASYTLEQAVKDAKAQHLEKWAENFDLSQYMTPTLTKGQQLQNTINSLGSGVTTTGQAFTTFGMILSNLGLQGVGSAFLSLGSIISSVGMTISSVGNAFPNLFKKIGEGQKLFGALKSSIADAGLGSFMKGLGGVAIAGIALTAVIKIHQAIEKRAKDNAEKVTKTYEEAINKSTEKISALTSAKDTFAELSKGVDQYGNNISLTQDEYDEYLKTSRDIADLTPELIRGYDAQGNAIIATGAAIDELIAKEEELKKTATETFITNSSMTDLMGGIRVSDAFKKYGSKLSTSQYAINGNAVNTGGAFNKQMAAIRSALTAAGADFESISQQLFGKEINLFNPSQDDLRLIAEHYNDIINLVQSQNSELTEKQKEGLQDAFSGLGEGWNDMLGELQPLSQSIGQYLSSEGLDTIGLGLGEEFTESFNKGLESLTMTAAMENWDASKIKEEARNYAEGFKAMTAEGSEYANIMEKVTAEQEKYNDAVDDPNAVNNYKEAVEDYATQLENLADKYADGTVAGELFANSLRETANHIRNYTTESVLSLGEAINTLSDEFASARGAQERFQEATKGGDYYTAAEGYKSILETMLDEKNVAGNGSDGSLTFWAGADELLGQKYVDSHTSDQIVKQVEKIKDCFEDGLPGVQKFGDLLVENADKLKGLGKINEETGQFEFDFKNLDDLEKYADLLGMSEDALAALIDKSRQWVPWTLGDPKKIRQALEASETAMAGTSSKGQNLLYTSESSFREEARRQGIRGDDYTKTKADTEAQGVRFLNVENLTAKNGEYANQVLDNIGLKGADKTLDNAVAALTKMGFSLEDQQAILTSKGIKLADGEVTGEQIAESYNEQAYALENPTVAGIAGDTGVIASAATAMLASMGILTDDAKKKIDESTDEKYVDDLLNKVKDKDFTDSNSRNAARQEVQQQIDDYNNTLNLLEQGRQKILDAGGDTSDIDARIDELTNARDQLQGGLDAEADSWDAKVEKITTAFKNFDTIAANAADQKFLNANAVDTTALLTTDSSTFVTQLQQFTQEGNLAEQTVINLAKAYSELNGVDLSGLLVTLGYTAQETLDIKNGLNEPFHITTKLEGDDLRQYINDIDGLTQKEKFILLNSDVTGAPKVESFLNVINNEFGDGSEETKQVLIEATAKIAGGDTEGAHNILQEAFGDQAEEVETKLNLICDGSIANKGEVEAALKAEVETLSLQAEVKADIKTNVIEPNFTAPKGGSINYTAAVDEAGINSARKNAESGATMPIKPDASKFNAAVTAAQQTGHKTITITPSFAGTWTKTLTINKEEHARGRNFSIPAHQTLSFGSAARGMNLNTAGGKGKKVALVGEEGFEVGYIPSEQRSVIFGANGPEMTTFPSDTIIYPHEQSKKILRRGKGSHATAGSFAGGNTGSSGGIPTTTSSTIPSYVGSTTIKTVKETGKKVTQTAEKAEKAVGKVSVWWENIARKTEITQRKMDSNQKAFEKYITDMQATLRKTGTIGKGNAYIANLGKYIGYNEAQVNKANKELSALNTYKKGTSTQKQRKKKYGKAGYDNIVQISYEKKNSKGKKETVNRFADLSGYIKWDKASGTYVVDQKALNKIKNKSQRKATAEAANKELNDRLSKKYKAQDNIEKAKEELEKFSKTLYDTFFGWEISLNKIWNITQKIEAAQAKISRTDAMTDLIESQVSSGKRSGRSGADQSLTFFQQRLKEQEDIIAKRKQAIRENTKAVTRALTTTDEKKQLDEVQKKLKDDKNAQKTIEREQKKVDTVNANIAKYKKEKKDIQAKRDSLVQERRALRAALKKAKTKKVKDAIQRDIDKINERIEAKDRALRNRDTWIQNNKDTRKAANDAITEAKKSVLNDTQRAGYEAYEKELNNRRQAIFKAKKFGRVKRNADGTVEINFDSKLLEQERLNGNIDEELAKFIEEYYTTLEEASKNLDESIENTITDVNEYYNTLAELKDQWADYESQLVQITEESNRKQLENLQKLSDSVKKALDDLFNDVKTRLDDRRKQEDNAKTESDISKKQQRLAALRADTSGGHQVEIAQLESEIAEAQQNYQRSLEDQLLEKLQQQGDEAAKQRERQIALQEQLLTTANNIALVDAWMANPAAYEDELRKAYRDANDYENKGIWGQEKIDRDFESFYLGLLTNQDKQVELNESIGELTATLNDLMDLQKKSGMTIAELGQENASISTMHDEYGFSYKAIRNEGYEAKDFADDDISYESAREAFTAKELSEVEDYKADANKEIKQDAYTKKLNSLKKQKKLSYKDITALQSVANDVGYHAKTFLPALVGGKGDNITWTMVLNALKGHWSKYRLALSFSSDGFKKAYDKVYGKGKYKENLAYAKKYPKKYSAYKYQTGGLATQTGPAWLDGTPSRPELVLSAQDTKNFIALKDVLDRAMRSTKEINNSYGGDTTYEININVDKIANDYDVDKMAERIKKIIVKDSSYRNVTQVRNFR